MDSNKIKASISALIANNEQMLLAMRELSNLVATKDSAIEDFIVNNVMTSPQGNNTTTLSNVDLDTAKNSFEKMRVMHKKVKENTIAIKKLVAKLRPFELPGRDIHTFNSELLIYRRFIKCGSITPFYSNIEYLLANIDAIMNNLLSLKLTSVEVPIIIETNSPTSTVANTNMTYLNVSKNIIKKAYENGLEVVVKIIPIVSGEGVDISTSWNPSDKNAWFNNYEREILVISEMLNELKATTLIVGSNFANIEKINYSDKWKDMLVRIKDVFHGILTYTTTISASNLADKIENELFSNIDFLSVSQFELPLDNGSLDVFRSSHGKSLLLICSDNNLATQESYFKNIQNTFKDIPWMMGVVIDNLFNQNSSDIVLSGLASKVIKDFNFTR